MRVLLINPRHPAVASRCHQGQMPPLGLLAVGGPIHDAGHQVRLIDAEFDLTIPQVVSSAAEWAPDATFIGHSGSTSAHPVCAQLAQALKKVLPNTPIIYGGVFPTYHAREILAQHREIDFVIRGEGEATPTLLLSALQNGTSCTSVKGIGFQENGVPYLTEDAAPIPNLDAYRIGWELIEDWDRYQYWGLGRAAVIQFSRGCPHHCTYCGQRGFWTRWRHRDPVRVANEIGWLHQVHNVRFVDLADENPTTSPELWRTFLEALAAQKVPVQLVGTIRSADIVRDEQILPLYKQAGFSRILMGVETTNAVTQQRIRKGITVDTDRQAVRLLRQHDILSQVAYVVGFEEQKDRDFLRGIRDLLRYDPDQINAMYVTPHRWTAFYRESATRKVVDADQSHWDYRHQVLSTGIPTWRVFLWVKLTEAILQLRPRALWRVLTHRDPIIRKAIRWCYGVGRKAWLYEVLEFLFRRRRQKKNVTLQEFWGAPCQSEPEHSGLISLTHEPIAARPTSSRTN